MKLSITANDFCVITSHINLFTRNLYKSKHS